MKNLKTIVLVMSIFSMSLMQASENTCHANCALVRSGFTIAMAGLALQNTSASFKTEEEGYDFQAKLQKEADSSKLSLFNKNKPSFTMHRVSKWLPVVGVVAMSQGDYTEIGMGLVGAGIVATYYCAVQLDYAQRKTVDNKAPYLSGETYETLLEKTNKNKIIL